MLFLLRNLSYIILIITGDNAGVKQKGDKNDIKNTSHSINKKSRRQNVYDLENTLAGAEGFEPSARGFGDIYQFCILIALDKSSKYVMI